MSEECIFCKIVKGEIPAQKVLENEQVVAFWDINPIAPTHVLVVPRKHIPTLNDLTTETQMISDGMMMAAREVAKKTGIAESGYRVVLNCNRGAGQEVFHLHLHVLGGRPLGSMG